MQTDAPQLDHYSRVPLQDAGAPAADRAVLPAKRSAADWFGRHRTRLLRMTIGLLILVPGVWAALYHFVLLRTTDAMVTARTVTIRSPIAGVVRVSAVSTGDALQTGQIVATVDNIRVDDSRLAELSGRVQAVGAEIDGARGAIGRLEEFLFSLRARGNKYGQLRASQLEVHGKDAMSQLEASKATSMEAAEKLERAKALLSQGLTTQEVLSTREREYAVARAGEESALQRLESLRVERLSMRAGFTLDNFSDRPYSMQRVDEVELLLLKARTTLEEQSRYKEALQTEIATESRRVELLKHATIENPRAGRVVKVLATDGEYVNAGQALLEVSECSKLVVIARLPERKYAELRIGTRANFKPVGSKTTYHGVVVQKLGKSSGEDFTPRMYSVALRLPLMAAQLGPSCEIGLPGEASFGD